jgi:hypothetical protein
MFATFNKANTDTQNIRGLNLASTTIDLLLEMVLYIAFLGSRNSWTTTMETRVFSTWSVPRSFLEDSLDDPVSCQF